MEKGEGGGGGGGGRRRGKLTWFLFNVHPNKRAQSVQSILVIT